MTKKEWKALKKEKGMKVYVLRYGGGRDHMTPKDALEYTIDTERTPKKQEIKPGIDL